MAQTPDTSGSPADRDAADALRLMREARFAGLATIDAETGGPYASLVNIALPASGRPVILISALARHTANLRANPAASLLIAEPSTPDGDPLASPRVTLSGRFGQLSDDSSYRHGAGLLHCRSSGCGRLCGFRGLQLVDHVDRYSPPGCRLWPHPHVSRRQAVSGRSCRIVLPALFKSHEAFRPLVF